MIPDTWNKEIGAMRIRVIIFIAAVMMTGCVHLDIQKNISALGRIEPGDTQAAVALSHQSDESESRLICGRAIIRQVGYR